MRRGIRALSWCVGVSTVVYAVTVVLLLVLFRTVGERCWFLWPALFMPPQFTLLPLTVLLPLGVLFCPRSLLVDGVVLWLILFVYMGLRWPQRPPSSLGPTITVMSCNVGQRNKARLSPFIESQDPDLIALQDASHQGDQYARQYPGRHVRAHGEFVLISRFPIRSSELVDDVLWRHGPVAARFVLDWAGTPLVLYNVHFPSPRFELGRLMGLGLAKEWVRTHGWMGTDPGEGVAMRLEGRPALAGALCVKIGSEPNPLIVAGDLNMPHWGYMYKRVMAERLRDAHDDQGRGFGFTFPGVTRNPISLFGPWLRLDYLLCSNQLRACAATVEPRSRAQHRAVAAKFVSNK